MIKTVKCKLIVTEDQALAITETMVRFAQACNEIALYRDRQKMFHRWVLSAYYYHYVREKYGLTANYCIRVFDRVAGNRNSAAFKPTSLVIDKDLFRYIEATEEATASTVCGRIRFSLGVGDYQRPLLKGWKCGPGTINYDRHRNCFYANLCIKSESPAASGANPLGVDLGINRIATLSNGLTLSGREVNRKREKFARTKASLQSKGTRGCKRLLKRLGNRERRFQRSINHQISKRIVQIAKDTGSFLALEDLKGIVQRVQHKGKRMRRMMGRWSFYMLRQFIAYKAAEAGVAVVFVDPRNTSKGCSRCGAIGTRKKHKFSCGSCGLTGDADVLAAVNIAAKGAQANRPEVARI